ncbi:hypothetical protein K0U00_46190, partial [Paenibacillus sepulcri]|nr:hypothetical protein [Paenibacillus sepulcri]
GDVAIAPYRLGAKTPCQFCAYKPVCQFDPLIEGNAFSKLHKPGKDEVWQLLAAAEEADGPHGLDLIQVLNKNGFTDMDAKGGQG